MTKSGGKSPVNAGPSPPDSALDPPESSTATEKLRSRLLLEVASSFSGPLPPPRTLAGYEDVVPGAADRIIRMAEIEGEHRRAMERSELDANRKAQARGQYLAFVVTLLVSMGGIYLLATGHGLEGLVALLTPLAALAAVFLVGRSRRKKQRRIEEALEDLRTVVERRREIGSGEGSSGPLSDAASDDEPDDRLSKGTRDESSRVQGR